MRFNARTLVHLSTPTHQYRDHIHDQAYSIIYFHRLTIR